MTRKNFIFRLIAVLLVFSAILSSASAFALEVNYGESNENLKIVYVTWQYPIPPSEEGDKLTIDTGVLVNNTTYVSDNIFNVLDIPKSPEHEGLTITVDGYTNVYYPLRQSAEQSGYSILWAPKNEQDGKVLDYWVYIAKKDQGKNWIQVVDHEVPEDNYKYYDYYYAYSDDSNYWWSVAEKEIHSISKESATIVE